MNLMSHFLSLMICLNNWIIALIWTEIKFKCILPGKTLLNNWKWLNYVSVKWNHQEVYSEILIVDFHVMCQIMDYPLKLMRNYLKIFGFFYGMLWSNLILECHPWSLSVYFSWFPALWHYLLALNDFE
jgi:hypothetical protein